MLFNCAKNSLNNVIVFLSVLNASQLFTHMATRKIYDDSFAKSRPYMDRYAIYAI